MFANRNFIIIIF